MNNRKTKDQLREAFCKEKNLKFLETRFYSIYAQWLEEQLDPETKEPGYVPKAYQLTPMERAEMEFIRKFPPGTEFISMLGVTDVINEDDKHYVKNNEIFALGTLGTVQYRLVYSDGIWADIVPPKKKPSEAPEGTIEHIINYIKNDAVIAIPINRFFDSEGEHLTKKEYGRVLLEVLCEELEEKFTKGETND